MALASIGNTVWYIVYNFATGKVYTWSPMKNVIFSACAISMQLSRGGRAKRAKEEKSQLIHAESQIVSG